MNELEHRAPHHIEDLQGDIMQSNTNLGSDVKILMPGGDGDDRVKFIRFRDVLRTKQFYLLIFIDFCQTAFWMLLVSTVIYCEGSQQVYNSPNGFFSVGSNGLVNALAITATAQPLVGYVSDHIGVRFSFMLWLLTMGTVAFIIPLFVRKMKKDETIDQILIGNEYPTDYLFLLTGALFGCISLQTSVTSAINNLFGIYSGGRTLAVLQTVSRILGLLCALLPVYLNNWQTKMNLYWAITGVMGGGLCCAMYLNPYALVEEERDVFAPVNTTKKSKYDSVKF